MTARYPVRLNGQVLMPVRSRVLPRRPVKAVDVEVADLSVTGAALLGRAGSPLAELSSGQSLELRFGGEIGVIRVRHVAMAPALVMVGIEFVDLSPELTDIVHRLVEAFRGEQQALAAYWSLAR